jgi:Putative Ig domain
VGSYQRFIACRSQSQFKRRDHWNTNDGWNVFANFQSTGFEESATVSAKPLSITIGLPAAPHITTSSLPAGAFDVAYNQTVSVTGGIGTLVWGVTSGGLPPGLNLNTANGNISGTPTSSGSFTFTLRVTDSIPQFDEQDLTITINSASVPPRITTDSLPEGKRNEPYAATLEASGGTIPYTWSVTPALPTGLTLAAATGVISGTPTATSNMSHDFTVRDSTNQTTTKELRLRIRKSDSSDNDD